MKVRFSPKNWFSLALALAVVGVNGLSVNGQDSLEHFEKFKTLFDSGKRAEALEIIREIEKANDLDDESRKDVRWAHLSALSQLAKQARQTEEWDSAKKFTAETLDLLAKSSKEFSGSFLEQLNRKEYWTYKNMIIACHGLEELDEANGFRNKMYEGYKNKSLPKGIDESFNIEFFTYQTDAKEKNNVWCYEAYPKLGDPETEGSFTKFAYLVYSTKEDGSDNEPLFRLHVLKFHKVPLGKEDDGVDFDYVLTKRFMKDGKELSGTFFQYTYKEPVDIKKLRRDVREFLKEQPRPWVWASGGSAKKDTGQDDKEKDRDSGNDNDNDNDNDK